MSRSYFIEERRRRIQALHKQVLEIPEGVPKRRLIAAFAYKWGLRASTIEGYLAVLEDAGLIVIEDDLVKPPPEVEPE